MLDVQIAQLLTGILNAGMAARSIADVTVQRAQQPRQMGIPSGAFVAWRIVTSLPYGWPARIDVWDETSATMTTATAQVQHTRIQLGCVMPESPATPTAMTSRDLAVAMINIIQHDDALAAFRAADSGITRATNIVVTPYNDDRDRFSMWAAFDFILTHKDVFTELGARITRFEGGIYRV